MAAGAAAVPVADAANVNPVWGTTQTTAEEIALKKTHFKSKMKNM